jgi:hypothetical protein
MERIFNIPEGSKCIGCMFLRWSDEAWEWVCDFPYQWWEPDLSKDGDYIHEENQLRCKECIKEFEYGAVITILPKTYISKEV